MIPGTQRVFAGAFVIAAAPLVFSAAGIAAPAHRIALVVDADGSGRSSRIYVANPDGSDLRPASPGVGRDRDPAFSPTGQTLAFQTSSGGAEQIVLLNLEGGTSRVLVEGGAR